MPLHKRTHDLPPGSHGAALDLNQELCAQTPLTSQARRQCGRGCPQAPAVPPCGEPRPPHGRGKASAIKSRSPVLSCHGRSDVCDNFRKLAFKKPYDDARTEGFRVCCLGGGGGGSRISGQASVKSANIRWNAPRLFLRRCPGVGAFYPPSTRVLA